jgi:hypothetical protein
MMTRARGSGSTIRRRSSHIRIVLTDEIEIKKRERTSGKKKKGAAKKKTTSAKSAEVAKSPKESAKEDATEKES